MSRPMCPLATSDYAAVAGRSRRRVLAPIPEWAPDYHRVHDVGVWFDATQAG
jgi:hypothetical protein